jgi:phosphomannomutase
MEENMKHKELIVFDLDGTLAESKSPLTQEMANALRLLLESKKVAVISGGAFSQYEKQFLKSLDAEDHHLERLFLFPTCSTTFFKHNGSEWTQIYNETLSENEKKEILAAFDKVFIDINYSHPKDIFGEIIEDRDSQITFSAHGQKAPIEHKRHWNENHDRRNEIREALLNYIPHLEVKVGGSTSVDITKKGIDKAYGINKIEEHLGISKEQMLFIGDALYPGGNDYPVKEIGVDCISVTGPEETIAIIRRLL